MKTSGKMVNHSKYVLTVFVLLLVIVQGGLIAQDQQDALLMYNQGRYEAAIELTLKELQQEPRNMNSYTVLGWSLNALGRYQESLDYAAEALKVVPYEPRILELAAEANFYLGNNTEALRQFELYATITPTGFRINRAYFYMGEIFIRLEEFERADIAFTTAVFHTPNSARWWTRLGYARELAEDYPHALEAYNKALSLNDSFTDAARGRSRVQPLVGTDTP